MQRDHLWIIVLFYTVACTKNTIEECCFKGNEIY